MDLPDAIARCLSKPGAAETTPFGPEVLVYKVGGRVFALTNPADFPPRMNLKCDPARALELRDEFEGVVPGYHMNKKHCNTVTVDGSIPSGFIAEWIDRSYDLAVASLSKNRRP